MTRTATAILAALVTAGTLAALAVAEPWPAIITGTATAIDGDTLRLAGGARIRLSGIDAPEAAQTCSGAPRANLRLPGPSYACGAMATAALRHMLDRDPRVTCRANATDRYGRTIAVCENSEGDLGARMVATGNAVAYRRYSTAYVDQEAAAKVEHLGLWQGAFQTPEDYRREHKR